MAKKDKVICSSAGNFRPPVRHYLGRCHLRANLDTSDESKLRYGEPECPNVENDDRICKVYIRNLRRGYAGE